MTTLPLKSPSSTLMHGPRQNRILAGLDEDEYARLADDLEVITLSLGQVLYEAGDKLGFVYFPTSCIVSMVLTNENGSSAELAMIGNDGLVGMPLVLADETTMHMVVVQSAGIAYRLRAQVMLREIHQSPNLQVRCLRYVQALVTQMAQSVACNRRHTVEQQLCRRLLLILDQLPDGQLNMTHEHIANMLGVRREGVTEAAGKLQTAGLIHYRRGHIAVTDRTGLEARACECYRAVKTESDRLFHLATEAIPRSLMQTVLPTLRKRAEARLNQSGLPRSSAAGDTDCLLHELQLHQIELEMQLEELGRSNEEANSLRERYADIYDFAPVSFFTLNAQGVIFELNLAGAILLGIKRSQTGKYRFADCVKPEYASTFNRFHADVLQGRDKKHCEIVLMASRQRPEATVRIEAVPDENGRECRMVVIDIALGNQAETPLPAPFSASLADRLESLDGSYTVKAKDGRRARLHVLAA